MNLGRRAAGSVIHEVAVELTARDAEAGEGLHRGLGPREAFLRAAPPPHMEFLLDRQGYVRARWLPGAPGRGWDSLQTLVDQILLFDKETPADPPPDEHVH